MTNLEKIMRNKLGYLHESKLVVRQGNQLRHLHQGLKQNDEATLIDAMAREYCDAGRVQTVAEGMMVAGAIVIAFRSTEAGERVPERARARLATAQASTESGKHITDGICTRLANAAVELFTEADLTLKGA
jgi:hypothetical protein